jgi:hypothetical protein
VDIPHGRAPLLLIFVRRLCIYRRPVINLPPNVRLQRPEVNEHNPALFSDIRQDQATTRIQWRRNPSPAMAGDRLRRGDRRGSTGPVTTFFRSSDRMPGGAPRLRDGIPYDRAGEQSSKIVRSSDRTLPCRAATAPLHPAARRSQDRGRRTRPHGSHRS